MGSGVRRLRGGGEGWGLPANGISSGGREELEGDVFFGEGEPSGESGKDEPAAAASICNGFRAVGSDRVLSFVVDSVSIYWSISYLL